CTIFGCSTETIKSKRAEERAGVLARLLQGELPNFFVVDQSKASKLRAEKIMQNKGRRLGEFSGVVLYIHVPPQSLRRVVTNYINNTHEFGHMLGCPDEYQGLNCTGIKDLMQLDEIVPAVLRNLPVPDVKPLAPGQHFSNEAQADNVADNVVRMQKQQKAFAQMIETSGVDSPMFFGQNNILNGQELQASQAEWYAERTRIRKKYGQDS